jgi:hypothetical protein
MYNPAIELELNHPHLDTFNFSTFQGTILHLSNPSPSKPKNKSSPKMALPPKFKAHRLFFYVPAFSSTSPLHTVEIYLDYVCPYSASS